MKSEVCPLGLAFGRSPVVMVVGEQKPDWGAFMRECKEGIGDGEYEEFLKGDIS